MKYEFEIFDRIIFGDLSPFSQSQADFEKYSLLLKDKHQSCYNVIIANFKKSGNKFTLLNKKVISSLHPFAGKVVNPQRELFQNMNLEELSPEVYKLLELKKSSVINISYSNLPNKTSLSIKESRNCEDIPGIEARYYYYNDLLKEEVIRIKENIKKTILDSPSVEATEHHIHKLQQALVNLSFQVIKFFNPKQQSDIYKIADEFTDSDILNLCFINLEDLMRFFEKNYLNYINQDILIPYRSALMKIYNIHEKLELVKPVILNLEDSALLKIIYVPILKLSNVTIDERMTYKDLIYFTAYLNAFQEEIKENPELSSFDIIELLYRVNYNSIEFQNYKTKRFKEEVEKREEISEKIDYLYHCLKSISQRNCKVNIAFDADLPSIKDQLISWVEEEITYLNKKLQLSSKPQALNLFSDEDKVKLQSGLTVSQLAFFYRLQAEVGIISHKILRDIFRHISESYQTSKVTDISIESIKNKYYQVDNGTIEVIKDKVIEILNQIKSH
ncbi:MAG: hypothetical protein HYX39_09870 [Bacteroidetes bacterium]|nr:hypothetical protein [Bacteroidota bacterium]